MSLYKLVFSFLSPDNNFFTKISSGVSGRRHYRIFSGLKFALHSYLVRCTGLRFQLELLDTHCLLMPMFLYFYLFFSYFLSYFTWESSISSVNKSILPQTKTFLEGLLVSEAGISASVYTDLLTSFHWLK